MRVIRRRRSKIQMLVTGMPLGKVVVQHRPKRCQRQGHDSQQGQRLQYRFAGSVNQKGTCPSVEG